MKTLTELAREVLPQTTRLEAHCADLERHLRLVLQDCEYWRTRYAGPDYIAYPAEKAARNFLDSMPPPSAREESK